MEEGESRQRHDYSQVEGEGGAYQGEDEEGCPRQEEGIAVSQLDSMDVGFLAPE